ncbi:MAG: diaminopimelate epimerase [Elusimicrobiota bacterium]
MKLPFWKLAGAGNDFILLEASRLGGRSRPALARRLCERRRSIGADGLLVVSRRPAGFDHYNADGSRAFCGNGARCAAVWMRTAGWIGRRARLGSPAGTVEAELLGPRRARVRMPAARRLRSLEFRVLGRTLRAVLYDTGVPHAVVRVRGLSRWPVYEIGRLLRGHPAFGRGGANVDFIETRGGTVFVRTYERGVEDETLACGTGAVAAALEAREPGRRSPVRVAMPGGRLSVAFAGPGPRWEDVRLEGPAEIVFKGEVQP